MTEAPGDTRPAIAFGFTWDGTVDALALAARLGVRSLWVGGHIAFRDPTVEPVVQLARLAALTESITIGTATTVLPLYPPAVLAKQIADIDRVSGGRVVLGVGSGGDHPPEFSACQVPLAGRGRRMDEAIDVLRALWAGDEVDLTGPYFPMTGVRIDHPHGPGGPPIVVCGRAERAMRRAALMGDGWMPYLYSPRRYEQSVATIRSTAEDAGRDLDRFRWMNYVFVHVDDDTDAARRRAIAVMSERYQKDMTELVDRVAVVGDVATVAEGVAAFVAAGARQFVLVPIVAQSSAELMDAMVTELVPTFAKTGARHIDHERC